MNSDKIKKLENSEKLKKKIFGKDIWRNYAIIPPSLVLFSGITGLVYLLNIDKLISVYCIPFVIIFLLGTIWLKATQKYIIKKKTTDAETFILCLSIPLKEEGGETIMIFSTGKNRNNKHYLEKEKQDILQNPDIDLSGISQTVYQIDDSDIYLTTLPKIKKIIKSTPTAGNHHWLIYTGNSKVNFFNESELNKYS